MIKSMSKGGIKSGKRASLKRNKIKAYKTKTDNPMYILHSFPNRGDRDGRRRQRKARTARGDGNSGS